MQTRRTQILSRAALALAASWIGYPAANAAHLYAAVEGTIQVYDVAGNGSLRLRQTVQSGPVGALATTPGGRFLYATSGSQYFGPLILHYASQNDGTIQEWSAPVKVCEIEGAHDLAMHPTTGDFLYTVATNGCAYRTDDADGHLTLVQMFGVGTDGYRIVPDPGGRYLVALCSKRGAVVRIRTNPDGTPAGTVANFGSTGWFTDALAADARFVYVGSVPDDVSPAHASVLVLLPLPDGSLTQISERTVPVSPQNVMGQQMLSVRGFLAVSSGGPGSTLQMYSTTWNGQLRKTDEKPIEVYALGRGAGAWTNSLWVATDDGIVTYTVGPDGKLTRISKAMVNGAYKLAFGVK